MTRMLMVTDVQDIIKRHQAQIITSLKDPDVRLNFLSGSIFLHPEIFCENKPQKRARLYQHCI